MGPRNGKLVFNSVLNFRRVTHFWLCMLETHVIVHSYAITNSATTNMFGFLV